MANVEPLNFYFMLELLENQDMEGLISYSLIRMAIVLVCWSFVFIANMVDFVSGRETAKALGEPINSKGYRKTFAKMGDYYRVLTFALLFDIIGSLFVFYSLPFASMIGSIAVIAIELLSVIENSRKKKSEAAEIPDMVKKIIQCTTVDGGKQIYQQITNNIISELNQKKNEKDSNA